MRMNSTSILPFPLLKHIPMKKKNLDSPGTHWFPLSWGWVGEAPGGQWPRPGLWTALCLCGLGITTRFSQGLELTKAGRPAREQRPSPTHPVQGAHAQLRREEWDGGIVGLQTDTFSQHLHSAGRLGKRRLFLWNSNCLTEPNTKAFPEGFLVKCLLNEVFQLCAQPHRSLGMAINQRLGLLSDRGVNCG